MSMMRSSNPALKVFEQPQRIGDLAASPANTMTVGGTVTATAVLLGICSAVAIGSWSLVSNQQHLGLGMGLSFVGMILGFILAMIVIFKPKTAPFLAPVYAACEGLFLGVISYVVSAQIGASAAAGGTGSPDTTIVFQAVGLTFGVAAAMLAAYGLRIIRPGKIFRAVIVSATGGIALFYLVAMLGSFVGLNGMAGLLAFDNASPLSIGISLFVVGIASLNLVLDFEFIEVGAQNNLPKYMEWYGGFALLVTLVWLYIELLRLMSKLRNK